MMVAGHDHERDIAFFNGTTYVTLDNLKDYSLDASYMIVDVGESIGYNFVDLND